MSPSPTTTHYKLSTQESRLDDGPVCISPVESQVMPTDDPTNTDQNPQIVVDDAVASDLWTDAYREAVESLGQDIDVAILKGKGIEQLFRQLEEIDTEVTQQSAFLAGVEYLHRIKVPLEKFKLALDLATPLTDIQPISAAVFGVVKGVTAVRNILEPASLILSSSQLKAVNVDCNHLCRRGRGVCQENWRHVGANGIY
jgi:hypothetical protein